MRYLSLIVLGLALMGIVSSCSQNKESEASLTSPVSFFLPVEAGEQVLQVVKGAMVAEDAAGEEILTLDEIVSEPVVSAPTKAELVESSASVSSFTVYGFTESGQTAVISGETATKGSTNWKTETDHLWTDSGNMRFFGIYPSGAAALSSGSEYSGVFTCTIPSSAAAQQDILFGGYHGSKPSGSVVPMTMKHPLAAVRFTFGTVTDVAKVSSVQISGVYSSGSFTPSFTSGAVSSFSCIPSGDPDNTVSGTGDVTVTTGTALGAAYTFALIPQDLATHNVTITFNFDGGTTTASCTLDSSAWESGKVYTYRVAYEKGQISVSVDDTVNKKVKSNLQISNDGEVTTYIRAALVGQWEDSDDNIVAPWDRSQGVFVDLLTSGDYWVEYPANSSVFYFKNPVDPSVTVSPALFSSYTMPGPPVSGAHLSLYVAVQAVEYDGTKTNVTSAWGSDVANLLNTK